MNTMRHGNWYWHSFLSCYKMQQHPQGYNKNNTINHAYMYLLVLTMSGSLMYFMNQLKALTWLVLDCSGLVMDFDMTGGCRKERAVRGLSLWMNRSLVREGHKAMNPSTLNPFWNARMLSLWKDSLYHYLLDKLTFSAHVDGICEEFTIAIFAGSWKMDQFFNFSFINLNTFASPQCPKFLISSCTGAGICKQELY